MSTSEARILHVTVEVPLPTAYAFACQPENFPRWAKGLSASLRPTDRGWVADTPDGEAIVHFSAPNDFGVLDHHVELAGRPDVFVPLRMIPNGDGTEVELVLFRQTEMSAARFEHDAGLVTADLLSLKALLEGMVATPDAGR